MSGAVLVKDWYDHHHHHPTTTTTATTTTTTTPVPQNTDEVDGVLFNTHSPPGPGRATPDLAVGGVTHLYGEQVWPAPTGVEGIKVYRTRFWILWCFSCMAMFQCLMWNTWGPISASVDVAFPGWGSGTVAMMGNWGTIMFVLMVFPMCYLINTHGIRMGVLVCAGLIAAGTLLRIVPLLTGGGSTFFTVMCHVCAVLVGTAGTLVMAAPPMIAAVWFPPKERTTATAFAQMLNQLGNGGSYLEPLVVREPSSSHPSQHQVDLIQQDIKRLLYIWAGVGAVMFLVFVAYLPAKPPSPPSLTSHVERLDVKESLKMLCRNRDLVLVTLSYSLSLGVPSAWASVLNYSLFDLGMSQNEAMWVGVAAVGASCVATLVVGRITDLLYGHLKLSLLLCMAGVAACFYWFFLLTWGAIPVSTWQIYVSVTCGLALNFAMSPLFFELGVENAYPCSEVMVGGLLTGGNNLVGVCFLFLFLAPFETYQWVTYVLLATLALALIPLALVKENYARSNIDRNHQHSGYTPI